MKRKQMQELIGTYLNHNKFGLVEVVSVEDNDSGKMTCRIVESNEMKKLIFNKLFFTGVDEFEDVPFVAKKQNYKKVKKEINYDKYRNHPLVKDIDSKEQISLALLKAERDSHNRFEKEKQKDPLVQ